MIDEKKIEEKARGFSVTAFMYEQEQYGAMEGFKAGATWALQEFKKSLWHDASEEPKSDRENETCFGIRRDGFDIKFSRNDLNYPIDGKIYSWKEYTEEIGLLKWAYLEDLMRIGREDLMKGGEK